MRLLLDTHVLLWAAATPERLSAHTRARIADAGNLPVFSAASIWEMAIKSGLGRSDFQVNAAVLRRGLLDNGYEELAISGEHAAAVAALPLLHKDPFDRMLIAQAIIAGITLLTADDLVAQYAGPIERV